MELVARAYSVVLMFTAGPFVQTGKAQEPPHEISAGSNYVRQVLHLARDAKNPLRLCLASACGQYLF